MTTPALDLYGGKQSVHKRVGKAIIAELMLASGERLGHLSESLGYPIDYLFNALYGNNAHKNIKPSDYSTLIRTLSLDINRILGEPKFTPQSPSTRSDWQAEMQKHPLRACGPLTLEAFVNLKATRELFAQAAA